MAKLALVAASLAALLGITQVFGQATQPMDCKSEMAKAEPMVASMKDEKQKQEAMKEMSMAREMMAKNDEQGCLSHIRNAQRMSTNRPSDR
jgi:hypothetical protein